MNVAVLTISDSGHAGRREDTSGPQIAAICGERGWNVRHTGILPDERPEIAARLSALADSGEVDVIFTIGGTGIAGRDVTPEATRDVIEKELPGIGELMRARGYEQTSRAVLSRAVAGTRGKVLIVNLPGSVRGSRQSLGAILELVPHIVDLLGGRTEHAG
jgi:molybdenum cofactor synthesis domain-containing protein